MNKGAMLDEFEKMRTSEESNLNHTVSMSPKNCSFSRWLKWIFLVHRDTRSFPMDIINKEDLNSSGS